MLLSVSFHGTHNCTNQLSNRPQQYNIEQPHWNAVRNGWLYHDNFPILHHSGNILPKLIRCHLLPTFIHGGWRWHRVSLGKMFPEWWRIGKLSWYSHSFRTAFQWGCSILYCWGLFDSWFVQFVCAMETRRQQHSRSQSILVFYFLRHVWHKIE